MPDTDNAVSNSNNSQQADDEDVKNRPTEEQIGAMDAFVSSMMLTGDDSEDQAEANTSQDSAIGVEK